MNNINWLKNYISNFTTQTIIELIIAVGIIVIFNICSSGTAYIITKILKRKPKKGETKNNKLYLSLKRFIKIIGIYIGLMFVKDTLLFNETIIMIIRKTFRIIMIYMLANIICECITLDSLRNLRGNDTKDGISNFVIKIIKGLIYIVATFIAILELGYDLSGLVTGLGLGSVVITLAAQNIAKDIIGGFVIFTDKPFKVGDWIQFGEYEGTVEEITFRSTRIRTFENSIVNVPNAIISNASIINCSRIEKRRYKINLGLELETPLNTVKVIEEKIRTMLKEKENVMDDSVIVRFDKITDNSINLLIYAFTNSSDNESFLREKEHINYKIMQILESEKVGLAYDTKTVFIKN